MKRMKIMLMAMMAIFVGTTFTSCLDSDNGPKNFYASGTIVNDYVTVYLKGDDGVKYTISNPSAMQFKEGDDTFYPTRATIVFNEIEGEDYTEGKKSYTVYFAGYYAYFFNGDMLDAESAESVTSLYALDAAGVGDNYLNVLFACYYEGDATVSTIKSGIKAYPEKWEGKKLYFKLVQNVEKEKSKVVSLGMCFPLPTKEDLKAKFPEIEFSGDDLDTIDIVVTADGSDGLITLESFKAKISN